MLPGPPELGVAALSPPPPADPSPTSAPPLLGVLLFGIITRSALHFVLAHFSPPGQAASSLKAGIRFTLEPPYNTGQPPTLHLMDMQEMLVQVSLLFSC